MCSWSRQGTADVAVPRTLPKLLFAAQRLFNTGHCAVRGDEEAVCIVKKGAKAGKERRAHEIGSAGMRHVLSSRANTNARRQIYDSKALDSVTKYLSVGRQLGYAGYLTLDSLAFFDGSGIYPFEAGKKLARGAVRFWLMGLIFSFVNSLYQLRTLAEKEKKMEKTEAEGKLEGKTIAKERKGVKTQLLCDICDMTIPLSALGYMNLDDGVVGLAGLVSSIIGLRAAWSKTA